MKDLKQIAAALPVMIPHKDTTTWIGSELLLTELNYDPKKIDPKEFYNVTYLHWRPHNHYRSIKQLYRKGKTQADKKKLVLEYVNKYAKIEL